MRPSCCRPLPATIPGTPPRCPSRCRTTPRPWARIKGLKIGVPREYFGHGLDPEVEAAIRAALETLGGLGAELVEVSLPHTEYAVATYYVVAVAEASSNLARYDGVKYGFRAEGRQPHGNVPQHPDPGVRGRGAPAHHAGHLYLVRRLL